MSTYKDIDPCTDKILDFIGGGWTSPNDGEIHNMEAGGSYNIVIGERPGREKHNLAKMQLTDLYALQVTLIHQGNSSGAVGRYQFIHGTLGTTVQALRLPMSTLYTPEIQDRLALKLLTNRGYQQWYLNKMPNSELAHQLSMEWASIPDPMNGGLSHYQGVGPNQAGCSLKDLLAMLSTAQSLRPRL